jgi:hypothetical protein
MVALRCKSVQTKDIASALVEKLVPQVKIIPGGPAAAAAEAAKMAQQLKVITNLDSLTELFSGGLLMGLKSQLSKLASGGLAGAAKEAAIKEIKDKMKKDAIELLKDKLSKTVGPALAAGLKDTLEKGIAPAMDEPLDKIIKDNLTLAGTASDKEKKMVGGGSQPTAGQRGGQEEDYDVEDLVTHNLNEMASRIMRGL